MPAPHHDGGSLMFLSWGKKARTEIGAVAGFGKVPALGDFVRALPRSDEMTAFEQWLTSAMEHAESKKGAAWKDAFARSEPFAFVWGGSTSSKHARRGIFAGVVRPSHDSVRRCFPIIVGAALPIAPFVTSPRVAPIALRDFFRRAARASAEAADAKSQQEFQATVNRAKSPDVIDTPAAESTFTQFCATTTASELAGTTKKLASALWLASEAARPFREADVTQARLAVKASLGGRGENAAAWWLEIVASACAFEETMPTFLWPLAGDDLIVHLGTEASETALLDLWSPDGESARLCDLGVSAAGDPALNEDLQKALDEDAPLDEVLVAYRR